jgi:hypothetical protein
VLRDEHTEDEQLLLGERRLLPLRTPRPWGHRVIGSLPHCVVPRFVVVPRVSLVKQMQSGAKSRSPESLLGVEERWESRVWRTGGQEPGGAKYLYAVGSVVQQGNLAERACNRAEQLLVV